MGFTLFRSRGLTVSDVRGRDAERVVEIHALLRGSRLSASDVRELVVELQRWLAENSPVGGKDGE